MNWVIDDYEDKSPIRTAAEKLGHKIWNISRKGYLTSEYDMPSIDEPTIFHVSINNAKFFAREEYEPGIICDFDAYKCTSYFPQLKNELLNWDGCFFPFGVLKDKKEWIFDTFGEDRAVFVRPDRGDKSFTGEVLYKENWEKDIDSFNVEPQELVLVARPQKIHAEYRVVTIDGEAITGSQYRLNGDFEVSSECPQKVLNYAQQMSKLYSTEIAHVIDIAQLSDSLKVVELNSFSCSGLYDCDCDKIVKKFADIYDTCEGINDY